MYASSLQVSATKQSNSNTLFIGDIIDKKRARNISRSWRERRRVRESKEDEIYAHLKNLGKAYEDLNLLKAYLQDCKSLCATIVDVMVSSILRILVHLFLYQSLSKLIDIQELQSDGTPKKPKFLCLHGLGTNAAYFKNSLNTWPDFVLEKMDLVFINGPCSADGGTRVDEGYSWFTNNETNTPCELDKSIAYIEDRMIELGPFDGVFGVSQGAIIGGALPGMQEHGACLTKVEKIKHVIFISGGKLGSMSFPAPKFITETAFSSPINIPSLHIFGENDFAKETAVELMEAYVDPLVFYHHGGHGVQKLDEEGLKIMLEFLKEINAIV